MNLQKLATGVVREPRNSLSQNLEAYWLQHESDQYKRVLSIGKSVEDREISWTMARVDTYRKAERSMWQRILGKNVEGSIYHPSGIEVVQSDNKVRGHLFTAMQEGINLESEIAKRITHGNAKILKISDQKLFMEGGVPVAVHTKSQGATLDHLSDTPATVLETEQLYKSALSELQSLIAKCGDCLSNEDQNDLVQLDAFHRKRVRWASLTMDGGMIAQEAGKIGDAWIFVVPPKHEMMQTQQSVHAMNYDNSGNNPYLSILPYKLTPKWAGLAIVHELSHLRDAVLKIEPGEGRTRDQYLEGEHRAYSVERALAFAYSDGKLQTALQSIVRTALENQDDAVPALKILVGERLPAICQSLDLALDPQEALSKQELSVRQGLYTMLIGFECARQVSNGNPARQKFLEKNFIEAIYNPTGLLPKE